MSLPGSSVASGSSAVASTSASAAQKPDRLYVGNLAPNVDEHTLIQVFSKFGQIVKLDFMFHKTGPLKGKPRGFAFIEFKSKDDALKALVKLHDKLLRGRKLMVTYANSAPHTDVGSSRGTYRRPTELPKTTTLSLLKNQQRKRGPQTPEQQIAAMEAKLAAMAKNKPPGTGPELPIPPSASASPTVSHDEEPLGDEHGLAAAEALEREMASATASPVAASPPAIKREIPGLPKKPAFL